MAPRNDRQLTQFLAEHRSLFVLTGAGCSTGSGIPDYRDAQGQWKRSPPMTYQAFTGSAAARRRYWARSLVGWPAVAQATPNDTHHALATLEHAGRVATLVTQNVDSLHQKAGSRAVIDLHGRLDTVICLGCRTRSGRHHFQDKLQHLNPGFTGQTAQLAPDGDADIDEMDFSAFQVPACEDCGGVIKPDVVFFGESVPRERVTTAMQALEAADAMLIIGSSLMVFSGYRFARRAAELGKPLVSVTRGVGRADDLLTFKIDAPCESILRDAAGAFA